MAENPAADRAAHEGELLRLLAENVQDYAIFAIDVQRRVQTWNAGAERLLGYQEGEILGQLADQFFTPEDIEQQAPQQEVQQALKVGRGEDDRWHMRKDGTRFWASGVMTPLWDERGKLRGFAKIIRDRTEWKLAEQDRLQTEANNVAILQTALDAIVAIDHDDRIIEFNPAAERMFGYQRGEVFGKKMGELLVPPHLRAQHYAGLERYLATGDGPVLGKRITATAMRSGGGEFPVELSIVRIPGVEPPRFTGYIRDITELQSQDQRRQQSEQALRESEQRFRGLMQQAPFSIQLFSPNGQTLEVNRAWEELWGVSFDQVGDYNVLEDPQLEAKGVLGQIRRAFAGETVAIPAIQYDPNETRPNLIRDADARRWVSAVAYPLKDPDGRLREVALVHEDITARKRVEDALRESEERFRGIVSQAIAGVAEVDLSGRFVFANERYCEIIGRPLDELLQLRKQDITYSEDLAANLSLFERIIRQGTPYVIEKRYVRPDGSLVWVNNSVSGLRGADGKVKSVVAVCVDITARRQAEEALREAHQELEQRIAQRTTELTRANQFLRALLESIHDGIVACDAEGRLTLFNRAAAEFHGAEQQAVSAGQWAARYDLYQSDGVTPLSKEQVPLFRALQEEFVQNAEMVVAPEGGLARTLLASGQAFFDEHGHKLGAVVSMRDITDRKRAEEALRRAHEELERRVAERTAELAQANEALKDADRRKDEFLAMLAHELRNPLAPIRSGLDLLSMTGSDGEITAAMQQQVEHLVRLVDDLLDVSRIMRGRVELRKEPVELAWIISRAVDAIRPIVEANGQELSVSLPAAPVWLNADPVRLTQVLSNLLNNASKYTNRGGRITLLAEQASGEVVVRVQDTGIGIEPELLPQVFDLFTQADRTIDRSQGGLGIGLTVVKSLVEMHDGTVTVHSAGLNQGSEFAVQLPTIPPAEHPNKDQRSAAATRAYRILIVDDNVAAAKMLGLLLRQLGDHQVELAHDGVAALEAVRQFRPHLILLDIGLPKMDGYEVARQLRRQPDFHNPVLIALTGYGTEEDRRRSLAAGFDDHFVKPPSVEAIRKMLVHPKLAGQF